MEPLIIHAIFLAIQIALAVYSYIHRRTWRKECLKISEQFEKATSSMLISLHQELRNPPPTNSVEHQEWA